MAKTFTNKISRRALKKALILWATNVDGRDYATDGVLQEIPYTNAMSALVNWADEPNEWIDTAIGPHRICDLEKIVTGDKREVTDLDEWAERRTDAVMKAYDRVIALLNKEAAKRG